MLREILKKHGNGEQFDDYVTFYYDYYINEKEDGIFFFFLNVTDYSPNLCCGEEEDK